MRLNAFGLALHSTAGDDQGTDGVRALKPLDQQARYQKNVDRGRKGNSTRDKKKSLVAHALYCAIQWELSVADSWGEDTPQRAKALDNAKDFRVLLKEYGYREPTFEGEMVTIQELCRRANAGQSQPTNDRTEERQQQG